VVFGIVSFNPYDVLHLVAAAICNLAGNLIASTLDCNVCSNLNRIFQSQTHSPWGLVFKRCWRDTGSPGLVRPQDINPRHQGNSPFSPFFAHTLPIGKSQKYTNFISASSMLSG
jgi:hypothetical protein